MKKTIFTLALALCGLAFSVESNATVQVILTCLDEDGNPQTAYTVDETSFVSGEDYINYINEINGYMCGENGHGFDRDDNGNLVVRP